MAKSKFPPLLHLTYVLQQSADELLLREAGISLSHVRIMSGLSGSITCSQRQLASQLRQTEANISRQLKAMKRLGLVSIEKNNKDGRQRNVKLSDYGQSKYQQAENLLTHQQKKISKVVDFDAERLLASF